MSGVSFTSTTTTTKKHRYKSRFEAFRICTKCSFAQHPNKKPLISLTEYWFQFRLFCFRNTFCSVNVHTTLSLYALALFLSLSLVVALSLSHALSLSNFLIYDWCVQCYYSTTMTTMTNDNNKRKKCSKGSKHSVSLFVTFTRHNTNTIADIYI